MQLLIKYFREPEKKVSKTKGIPFLAHTHTHTKKVKVKKTQTGKLITPDPLFNEMFSKTF